MRSATSRLLAAAAGATIVTAAALHGAAADRQRPSVPARGSELAACATDQEQRFETVRGEAAGVWVQNAHPIVGPPVASRKFENEILNAAISRGFYSVDGARHVACGTLTKWSLYNGLGAELDLHPHLNLSRSFRYLAEGLPGFGQPSDCETCIWGEVTLPASMSWLWRGTTPPTADSPDLPGGSIACRASGETPCRIETFVGHESGFCMYGPWVMERIYDFRAEIHPAEAFWGREAGSPDVVLYVTTDTSNRFDTDDDFRFTARGQDGWRTWASLPATYRVWAAVELEPGEDRVVTIAGRAPASDTRVFDHPHSVLRVSVTPGLRVQEDMSCLSKRGSRRTLLRVEATLSLPTRDAWQRFTIGGLKLPATRTTVTPAHVLGSTEGPDEDEEKFEDTPVVRLHALEWDARRDVVNGWDFDRERPEWGLTETEPVTWRFLETQHALYELPPAELSKGDWEVQWRAEVHPASLSIGPAKDVQLEFGRGRKLPTSVALDPTQYSTKRLAADGRFSVWLRFRPTPFSTGVRATPALVRLWPRIIDKKSQRSIEWPVEFRNVAPSSVAEVQDFAQWRKAKEPPEILTKRLLAIAANQGCDSVPYGTLLAHWSMTPDWSPWSSWNSPWRLARTLKLAMFLYLEDGAISPDEQRWLIRITKDYAAVVGVCR